MNKIILVNKSLKKDTFNEYKEVLLSTVKNNLDLYLDNIGLKIIIDKNKNDSFSNKLAYTIMKNSNKFYLYVEDQTLLDSKKNIIEFEACMFHEIIHIVDMHNISTNEEYKFNPGSTKFDSMEKYITYIGFRFWSELLAYNQMFDKYHNVDSFTMSEEYMADEYRKIILEYQKIIIKLSKNMNPMENIEKLRKMLVDFTYTCALFIATENYHTKKDKTPKETEDEDFKELCDILDYIIKYTNTMIKDTYGVMLIPRLYLIGKAIFDKFYQPFGFFVDKHGRYYGLSFQLKDNSK